MRFFNTEGPVRADKHYTLPPLDRIDLDQVLALIGLEKYFVFHAPRQTGKTTTLLALRDRLNSGASGDLRAVYANLEDAQALREDLEPAMRTVLAQIARQERLLGHTVLTDIWRDAFAEVGAGSAFGESLTRWCLASPRPLVLLLDEVDALVGDTLLSLLCQLRAGYTQRPEAFPLSVVLCGVRDVRDYRVKWTPDRETNEGGSPFNIRAESLRLGDLDEVGIRTLLGQHTEDTGQTFTDEALAAVWEQTRGQPWLVNALAFQACFRDPAGRDRSRTVTADDILNAREALIRRRETHLDQLGARLRQERVRRVIEPLLTGASVDDSTVADIEYSRDLGLIASDDPIRITNPIYREVIPRELTGRVQSKLAQQRTAWLVTEDGGLDVPSLLSRFQEYFREHSEHWISRFDYEEAGPQLLLQAFCQRVVNSGGRIEREYGLGRGRTDLLLMWPRGDGWRKFVVECKVRHGSRAETERRGLEQTAAYMDRCGAESGHLVIFDRHAKRTWREKIYRTEAVVDGSPITIWGM